MGRDESVPKNDYEIKRAAALFPPTLLNQVGDASTSMQDKQWLFNAGTMVAARAKEANHWKVDIFRAPQPVWLKTLWARGPPRS